MAEPTFGELSVIVPSRGRPDNIRRLAEAWTTTVTRRPSLFVAVDADDPCLPEYEEIAPTLQDIGGVYILGMAGVPGGRMRLGAILNYLGKGVATETPARAIGFMGDDHLPRTERWDGAVLDALADLGSGIVYGNDLLQGERLPTAAFMTSDIIRALGWMCPPQLEHLYIDNAWLELGRGMGRLRYLPDVVIEHLHPAAGKAVTDQTYAEANAPDRDRRDKASFEAWRVHGLPAALTRLRAEGVC